MCAFLLSLRKHIRWGVAVGAALIAATGWANTLEDIRFAELSGERFEVRMSFSEAPPTPAGYTIEQPARIVLDFPGVDNALSQKKFPLAFDNGKSAVVLGAGGRSRLILNLNELTTYATRSEGNAFIIEVGSKQVADYIERPAALTSSTSTERPANQMQISNIDFRRGEEGEGKVIFTLSDPNVSIDVEEVAKGVRIEFTNVWLPQELRRRLDVTDFATPINFVSSDFDGSRTSVSIDAAGDYDYLAYQADNEYVVSLKPLTPRELEEKKKRFAYTGEKLSLNFQDIEVRSVLQLIADFTELNLVASDTVSGNITLRLENVPWDQALNLVLKTKGLDKRQVGNVLMVAPAAEIAERERQELETRKQLQELAPLRTEFIRIRYANAKELFELFKGDEGGSGGDSGGGAATGEGAKGSILSERGQAIVDERTNSIILTDTEDKIAEFKKLVERIDIPIQQVMIEARIVIANDDFREEIGVRWGMDGVTTAKNGGHKYEYTGSLEGLSAGDGSGPEANFIDSDGDGVTDDERDLADTLMVDLGVANSVGNFTYSLITDNVFLGMELSALAESGYAEIVSQPKVITGDKQKATIESGTEIPYLEASSSGATAVAFKEAVLKLDVTPQITPDDRIIMDLRINQDSVGELVPSGIGNGFIPSIDVTELQTQVLVSNGQTVVLGGIYQTEQIESVSKVPFFGDVPYIGRLFRRDVSSEDRRELLIFITPKILAQNLSK